MTKLATIWQRMHQCFLEDGQNIVAKSNGCGKTTTWTTSAQPRGTKRTTHRQLITNEIQ